jgi:hypothetical protein
MATLTKPTLDRLIQEARIFLNQEDSSNSFWSDRELTMYANDAIRQYFSAIVDNAEGQFDTVTDLDIVSGTDVVDLPVDCFEVRAIYKKANDSYRVLPYLNLVTQDFDTNGGNSSLNYEAYYYFRGDSIVLRPIPNFSEVSGLKIEYTAFPETLIWGGDTMNKVSPLFKELIILYMVYKAKVKESLVNGTNTSAQAAALLQDTYTNFTNTVSKRSQYPTFVKPFSP